MTLRLARSAYDDVVAHAREGVPEEVCGVLAGERGVRDGPMDGGADGVDRVDHAVAAHRTENVAPTPRTAYELDPEELYAVVERIEDAGREVVGFYHSHPAGPPRPSATDVARATWTDHHYVVVALDGEPFVGAWRWTGEAFAGERVVLGDD